MKIVLAGGGTGGHIAPGLALAEAAASSERGHSFLFLLPSGRRQPFRLPANSARRDIPASGVCGRCPFSLPFAALVNFRGFLSSRKIYREFFPDVVVGMGGYSSVPAVLAASARKIPVVIQEQNRRAGRANRFLSRFAAAVALGFPTEGDPFRRRETRLTGVPLRETACRPASPSVPAGWGWEKDRPAFKVMVMGGSSGAGFINRLLIQSAAVWGEEGGDIGFIHLAGPEKEEVERAYRAAGLRAAVFGFEEEIGPLYSLADLLIARAGALTLAEAAWWGLPMLLVPYPLALDDHQNANARYFAEAAAARVFREEVLTPGRLVREVLNLKNADGPLREMSEKSRSLSSPRAAEEVLDLIEMVGTSGWAGGELEPVSGTARIKERRSFALDPVSDSSSSAPPSTDRWSCEGSEL